jgi:hypothetical protein
VSKVTEKIKTRSKPTPSENFNGHPLYVIQREKKREIKNRISATQFQIMLGACAHRTTAMF